MTTHGVLLCAVALFCSWIPSEGHNLFEGILEGANCFGQWDVPDTCEGTLVENFEPSIKRTGSNEPDTKIFLFTPDNPEDPEVIDECGGFLPADTTFNPALQTVIVIHGWADGVCRSAWMREYRDEFLRRGPHNVILVDWTWGSSFDFALAQENMQVVGQQLTFVLQNMQSMNKLNLAFVHFIGSNFGAHAAGVAAHWLGGVGRITALDPGYPNLHADDRLDPSDAAFIDVIHSSGGLCPIQDSSPYPLGHAEYYPNGGETFAQLSCVPYILISVLKLDVYYAFLSLTPWTCASFQAIQYFKTSIVPEESPYVSVECRKYSDFASGKCRGCGSDGTQCTFMGYDAPITFQSLPSKPRKFYLDTDLACPYVNNDGIDLDGFMFADYIGQDGSDSGSKGNFLQDLLNSTGDVIDSVLGIAGLGGLGSIIGGEKGLAGLVGGDGPLGSLLGDEGPLGIITGKGGLLGSVLGSSDSGLLGSVTGALTGGGKGGGLLGGLTGGGKGGGLLGGLTGGLTGGGEGGGLLGGLTGGLTGGGKGGGGLLGGLANTAGGLVKAKLDLDKGIIQTAADVVGLGGKGGGLLGGVLGGGGKGGKGGGGLLGGVLGGGGKGGGGGLLGGVLGGGGKGGGGGGLLGGLLGGGGGGGGKAGGKGGASAKGGKKGGKSGGGGGLFGGLLGR